MPEHVHLLLTEPERGNPSVVMQAIKQGFATLAFPVAQERPRPTTSAVERTGRTRPHLAASLLRFRRLLRPEEDREAALHAWQSGQTRTGAGTGPVGMEQLSSLCLRRGRTSSGQRTPESGDAGKENLLTLAAVVPTLRTQEGWGSRSRGNSGGDKAGPGPRMGWPGNWVYRLLLLIRCVELPWGSRSLLFALEHRPPTSPPRPIAKSLP
jgi:hypothetical protein